MAQRPTGDDPTSNPATSASFPQPLNPVLERTYAASIGSSRMTDVSDDGDDYRPSTGARPPSSKKPAFPLVSGGGENSRPSTGVSSQKASHPPPSRRGYLGMTSHRAPGPGSAAGSTGASSGRPASSTSRTHVPSITSHAFFRPMSSQRLQAQRSARAAPEPRASTEEEFREGNTNRYSFGSNPTTQYGAMPPEEHEPMPQSRGTVNTSRDGASRGTEDGRQTRHGQSQSLTDSMTPLQQRPFTNQAGGPPAHGKEKTHPASSTSPQSKTQRSFRDSFRLSSRGGNVASDHRAGDALSSAASSPKISHANVDVVKANLGRNYEYFTGNTRFFWGGRLQNTRDRPVNIFTGVMVVLPAVLYLIFSGPWIWHNISPAIPIIFGYLLYICLSSFGHASVTDPGIIPRNLHPYTIANPDDPLALGAPNMAWTTIKNIGKQDITMEIPTKYCKTCNVWRPPRAHHCRICDNCVETQDHHCVWLNNCVGRRNYRYFFTFVTTSVILVFLLIGTSLAQILLWRKQQGVSFGKAIDHWRVPFAMVIFGLFALPYPLALLAYHLFLMGRGETTREYLFSQKFTKSERHRPFTTGNFLRNWIIVLCRPRPPTYLHFKEKYIEGDQRFGPTRGHRTAPLSKEQRGGGMEMEAVGARAYPALGLKDKPSRMPAVSVPTAKA